jgi:hypothetical protein
MKERLPAKAGGWNLTACKTESSSSAGSQIPQPDTDSQTPAARYRQQVNIGSKKYRLAVPINLK